MLREVDEVCEHDGHLVERLRDVTVLGRGVALLEDVGDLLRQDVPQKALGPAAFPVELAITQEEQTLRALHHVRTDRADERRDEEEVVAEDDVDRQVVREQERADVVHQDQRDAGQCGVAELQPAEDVREDQDQHVARVAPPARASTTNARWITQTSPLNRIAAVIIGCQMRR